MINLAIHHATNVRLSHTYEENANSVTLEVVTDKATIEVCIYDLPTTVTDKLLVLSDRNTTHSHGSFEAL